MDDVITENGVKWTMFGVKWTMKKWTMIKVDDVCEKVDDVGVKWTMSKVDDDSIRFNSGSES